VFRRGEQHNSCSASGTNKKGKWAKNRTKKCKNKKIISRNETKKAGWPVRHSLLPFIGKCHGKRRSPTPEKEGEGVRA
jgi:hypothetical protein